jgi:hypothetical protein
LWLIIYFLETNGQDEELKLGNVIESELKSTDIRKEGEREGEGGEGEGKGEGKGEGEREGEEGGKGEGNGEGVGVEEKGGGGTGAGAGAVAGVGVVVEGVQEGEWDEDKWSVSESEYKKYVKDSDIEDYLRGELDVIVVTLYLHYDYYQFIISIRMSNAVLLL